MTELKIEVSGYDLVEALLEDGDLLDRKEFDDAVKAIVEDEIDRKIEKEVSSFMNDYDFSEIVPTVTIDEHSEMIESLQRQVDDLRGLNTNLFNTIEHLENRLTLQGAAHLNLMRRIRKSKILNWFFQVGFDI